jgi:ribosomal protein RSM22 (predicted rRNA methylase)
MMQHHGQTGYGSWSFGDYGIIGFLHFLRARFYLAAVSAKTDQSEKYFSAVAVPPCTHQSEGGWSVDGVDAEK